MKTDLEILRNHSTEVLNRARVELMIVRRLLRELKAAGYTVEMDTDVGEDGHGIEVVNESEALYEMFDFDEIHLDCWLNGSKTFVVLLFGNGDTGFDVINDYGLSLEPVIKRVMERWAE
jgi:hypothetical protein